MKAIHLIYTSDTTAACLNGNRSFWHRQGIACVEASSRLTVHPSLSQAGNCLRRGVESVNSTPLPLINKRYEAKYGYCARPTGPLLFGTGIGIGDAEFSIGKDFLLP